MNDQIPGAPGGGVGFDVPGGDPDQISAAAAIHADAADMLEMHAAVVAGAESSLDSAWQGQAAASYQQLSRVVRSRFNLAADGARSVAAGLREWSDELSRCQRAGKAAMHECEHWLKQQQHWFFALQDAERELANARVQLTAASAPNPFSGASPSAPPAGAGPFANPLGNLSAAALASAKHAVAAAEQDVAMARAKLKEATEQVLEWQSRGRRAWDEATAAAERATGMLDGIHVTPPPLAALGRAEPSINPSEPWYDHVLNIAGEVVGGVAAVAGVATALTFWIPGVGEVSGVTAGAAGATESGIDWLKVAVRDPGASVTESVVDTVLAVPGAGDLAGAGDIPRGLASLSSKGLSGALDESPVGVGRVVSGTLDGAGGAYGVGTTTKGVVGTRGQGSIEVHGGPAKATPALAGALTGGER